MQVTNLIFNAIIYNDFENNCDSLSTYFSKETNEFFLSCKKLNMEYLYMYNETNMYNIQNRNITSEEKTFIYYERKTNICNNLEESIILL